ncbi:MAG: type VI secretion system protein TssA [Gemmataceae bacterium]
MASEPLIAIDELLLPIPGDDPSGEPVPFPVRAELDEMRKDLNPDDFDANDPLRPTEGKKADWKGIVRKSTDLLRTSSKDLLLGARLVEALTKLHGHAGYADGVLLMRRMLEECWDRLHPAIEDGDLEVRAGQFNWLGDDGRGGRFPYSLKTIPLFALDGEPVTLHDWKKAQEGKGRYKTDQVEKAMAEATRERLHQQSQDLDRALAETAALLKTLNDRLGADAPALTDIRAVIADTATLVKGLLQRRGGPIGAAEPPPEEEAVAAAGEAPQQAGPGRRPVTRADLYAQLAQLGDQLAVLEPHSPIPFLIKRAVRLGQLPFPELMRQLMRPDLQVGLEELDRELGIEKTEP